MECQTAWFWEAFGNSTPSILQQSSWILSIHFMKVAVINYYHNLFTTKQGPSTWYRLQIGSTVMHVIYDDNHALQTCNCVLPYPIYIRLWPFSKWYIRTWLGYELQTTLVFSIPWFCTPYSMLKMSVLETWSSSECTFSSLSKHIKWKFAPVSQGGVTNHCSLIHCSKVIHWDNWLLSLCKGTMAMYSLMNTRRLPLEENTSSIPCFVTSETIHQWSEWLSNCNLRNYSAPSMCASMNTCNGLFLHGYLWRKTWCPRLQQWDIRSKADCNSGMCSQS